MKSSVFRTSTAFWMIGGLLLATLTAIAHHCFYSKIDQRVVQDLQEQEWFIRVGTGLAFSVKTLLAASAGLAYTQLLWCTLKTKPFTLTGLDALFAIVTDVFKFCNWEAWRHSLHLVLIALIIWYVEIDVNLQIQTNSALGSSQLLLYLPQGHSLCNMQNNPKNPSSIYLSL